MYIAQRGDRFETGFYSDFFPLQFLMHMVDLCLWVKEFGNHACVTSVGHSIRICNACKLQSQLRHLNEMFLPLIPFKPKHTVPQSVDIETVGMPLSWDWGPRHAPLDTPLPIRPRAHEVLPMRSCTSLFPPVTGTEGY